MESKPSFWEENIIDILLAGCFIFSFPIVGLMSELNKNYEILKYIPPIIILLCAAYNILKKHNIKERLFYVFITSVYSFILYKYNYFAQNCILFFLMIIKLSLEKDNYYLPLSKKKEHSFFKKILAFFIMIIVWLPILKIYNFMNHYNTADVVVIGSKIIANSYETENCIKRFSVYDFRCLEYKKETVNEKVYEAQLGFKIKTSDGKLITKKCFEEDCYVKIYNTDKNTSAPIEGDNDKIFKSCVPKKTLGNILCDKRQLFVFNHDLYPYIYTRRYKDKDPNFYYYQCDNAIKLGEHKIPMTFLIAIILMVILKYPLAWAIMQFKSKTTQFFIFIALYLGILIVFLPEWKIYLPVFFLLNSFVIYTFGFIFSSIMFIALDISYIVMSTPGLGMSFGFNIRDISYSLPFFLISCNTSAIIYLGIKKLKKNNQISHIEISTAREEKTHI